MRNKILRIAGMLVLLTAGLAGRLAAQDGHLPNVLLITVDSLRSDHLGCYGYKKDVSPNIDALAREGFLFNPAIAQASWTWPSLCSFVASLYPSTLGIYFWDQYLPASIPTLAQKIKGKGYSTGFISEHGSLSRLSQGFDTFQDAPADKLSGLTDKALLWFEKNKNKHFFLWLHYMETHSKYYCDLPGEKRSAQALTAKARKDYNRKYDMAVSKVDKQLKILLDKLRDLGIYEKTMVIITADHGEEMGEHGYYYTHGGVLWDSLLKVPLIFSYPQLPDKGKIIQQQVQLIDIAPTILEILKIDPPDNIDGQSLIPLMNSPGKHTGKYAFSEVKENLEDAEGCPYLSTTEWKYTKCSIREGGYKLIATLDPQGGGYELYDLENDPQESRNIAVMEIKQLSALKTKLEDWLNRPTLKIPVLKKPLAEPTKERLKSLGYLQ